MCNWCQMSQIYILNDVNIYLISIVYKTWPDLLHHFSGQPRSTSFLSGKYKCNVVRNRLRGYQWYYLREKNYFLIMDGGLYLFVIAKQFCNKS